MRTDRFATPGWRLSQRRGRSLVGSVRSHFRRLGLQRRIMLYVTIGLAVMFATVAYLRLGAIGQATRLVFLERLSTAYTTAGIIGGDLGRVATDVRERSQSLGAGRRLAGPSEANALLDRSIAADLSPFFRVTGTRCRESRVRTMR